jgi:uncharacterized paraquat-inducible protein A
MNKSIQLAQIDFAKVRQAKIIESYNQAEGFMLWLDIAGDPFTLVTQKNEIRRFKNLNTIYSLFKSQKELFDTINISMEIEGELAHCQSCDTYFRAVEDECCPACGTDL